MENSFYSLTQILICDPVAPNRAATRSALYSLGCRNIEIVASLRDFIDALDRRPPDIAICEIQAGEEELCKAIRVIRRDPHSYNPFVIIIVTAWTTNAALISQISNAGADDLLLRPFSASVLDRRIHAHVLRRKRFVVAADYIGPERRTGRARASDVISLDPPNSIKIKTEVRANSEEAARRFEIELRAARAKLNAGKLHTSNLVDLS